MVTQSADHQLAGEIHQRPDEGERQWIANSSADQRGRDICARRPCECSRNQQVQSDEGGEAHCRAKGESISHRDRAIFAAADTVPKVDTESSPAHLRPKITENRSPKTAMKFSSWVMRQSRLMLLRYGNVLKVFEIFVYLFEVFVGVDLGSVVFVEWCVH